MTVSARRRLPEQGASGIRRHLSLIERAEAR